MNGLEYLLPTSVEGLYDGHLTSCCLVGGSKSISDAKTATRVWVGIIF